MNPPCAPRFGLHPPTRISGWDSLGSLSPGATMRSSGPTRPWLLTMIWMADVGLGHWWNDHRTVARYRDGQWVPAPMRIERAWMWLVRPVGPSIRRIYWIAWIAAIIANDVWGGDWGWWLFNHPQVAAGIRTGLYVAAGAVAAGAVFVFTWAGISEHRRKKSKKET